MPSQVLPDNIPTAQQVAKRRLRSLLCRKWSEGDRLPSSAELAKLIDCGQRNTGVAVRELAQEGWLVSQQGLGTYVARLPDDDAVEQTSGALAGLNIVFCADVREIDGTFIGSMIDGFRTVVTDEGAAIEKRGVESLVDPTCSIGPVAKNDVLVLLNPGTKCNVEIPQSNLLVEINTALQSPLIYNGTRDFVTIDQEQGGALAGQLLVEHGYDVKDVCYIGVREAKLHTRFDATSTSRLWGLESALGGRLMTKQFIHATHYGELAGAAAVKNYLAMDNPPPAIFTATDEIAVGFVIGASAHGLSIGKDFQIIGFDGQSRGRSMPGGPLTTIDVPTSIMGKRAAELLIDRVTEPDQPSRKLQLGCEQFAGKTLKHKSKS